MEFWVLSDRSLPLLASGQSPRIPTSGHCSEVDPERVGYSELIGTPVTLVEPIVFSY